MPHFLLFLVSVLYLWVVYRHLRFKSAETKQINEGDYAAIPSYVKLMWIWRKHSAYHAGIGDTRCEYKRLVSIIMLFRSLTGNFFVFERG